MSVNPWDGGFPEALCGLSWLTYVAGQSVDSSLSLRQLGFVVLTSALPPPCCLQLLTPPHTRMHACTHARMHTRTHVRQRPAAVQCEPDGLHPAVHLGTVAAAVPGAEWQPAVWDGPTHPVAADGLEVHVESPHTRFFVTALEKTTWEQRRTRRDRRVVSPLCSLLSLRDNYLSGALPSNVSALWPPSWFDDNCFSGAADVRRRAACAPTPDSATRALRDLFNSTGGASKQLVGR